MIYVIDLCSKIVSNILRFFPAAILFSLLLTLLYRKVLRKDRWVDCFIFCIYLVLLIGETLWGRLGMNIVTEDFIGIGQLFENPWYVAAAVENVIMFIPFGFFAVRVVPGEKAWQRCLIAAAVTSGCIELVQYALHIGEAQLVDVLANLLGTVTGSFLRNSLCFAKALFLSTLQRNGSTNRAGEEVKDIQMRRKLYNILVNRHSGIRSRYHKVHDNRGMGGSLVSYVYLLFLNFCYYCLFCRFLAKEKSMEIYEEKRLSELSESGLHLKKYSDLCSKKHLKSCFDSYFGKELTVEAFTDLLSQYDVVSFDIFDTLIFRPFSEPADLFYLLGDRLGLMDVKRIRVEQEALARRDCYAARGHYEVTFAEIWNRMEREMGVPAEKGMQQEQELEMEFCYANPFMLKVFEELRAKGKKIICISDMYLPRDFLVKLLEKNGYAGIEKLYVSCEYGKNKGSGELFRMVSGELRDMAGKGLLPGTKYIHVGDNEQSDVRMAEKCGFEVLYYPNVNKHSLSFRPYDMSSIIGGAYRGIVDNRLYQGGSSYPLEYEYGFIYGGLFVLGYCHFIHEYCRSHAVEKLLFLSRDGDILKEVYDGLYPEDNTAYVYLSRSAATKLMAEFDRYDFFRRYLYHKVNQGVSVGVALEAMGLQALTEMLSDCIDEAAETWTERSQLRECEAEENKICGIGMEGDKAEENRIGENKRPPVVIKLSDELTDRNVDVLKEFILSHFTEVCSIYREEQRAARAYYEKELAGIGRAAAIDIGWAGSGAVSLSYLVEKVWRFPCEVTGIIAGTNTIHNREPDAGEMFLQNGKLVSYLFSQSHNRDVMKKHDPDKDYNVYWELLLSSPQRKFLGFSFEEGTSTGIYSEDGREVRLAFGGQDVNQEGIKEIRRGILDFVSDYVEHFKGEASLFNISGRDACAPMLVAAGHGEKYLKMIAKGFSLEKGI